MDISVLASVGSFVVSERVLKPKASVLVLLGCVLAYDLTTKTHDTSSLRVYRGPGLLAFSLMMVALSLRTWRRNGIACDELLFLPGTVHESIHSSNTNNNNESSYYSHDASNGTTTTNTTTAGNGGTSHHNHIIPTIQRSEGDVAAGGSWIAAPAPAAPSSTTTSSTSPTLTFIAPQRSFSQRSRARSISHDSSLSSIHEFVNNWDDEDNTNPNTNQTRRNKRDTNHDHDSDDLGDGDDDDDDDLDNDDDENDDNLMTPLTTTTTMTNHADIENHHHPYKTSTSNITNKTNTNNNNSNNNTMNQHHHHLTTSTNTTSPTNINTTHTTTNVERFRENHPNVTRIGSFFFFRSSTSSTQNATYAPSGPSVVGAAIDLSMPVLFNFHLFIEAWNHMDLTNNNNNNNNHSSNSNTDTHTNDDMVPNTNPSSSSSSSSSTTTPTIDSESTAKILPLIFLSVLIVRTFFPPGRRGRFWSTIKITTFAPLYRSRFRDMYIGDILTSLVRPLQDIIFALAYYVTVIWGSVTTKYGLNESGHILESSYLLHTIILPIIAILPLWWKFLQTLRECYDTGKRWPYLGNAFKYLSSSIVIIYGMTHPYDRRHSIGWLLSFIITLLYQIFWDTIMDWDLFIIVPKDTSFDAVSNNNINNSNNNNASNNLDVSESTMWFQRPISSVRPDSYWLLSIQRHIVPIRECIRVWFGRCPSYKQIQIRPRRLYKSESFYWRIFIYNTIFRFCWMLSFIPSYHLSSTNSSNDDEHNNSTAFSSDTNSYVGVLLPIAEILRRTLWGFLYLEIQTIRMSDGDTSCCNSRHQLYSTISQSDPSLIGSDNNNNNLNDTIELSSLASHDNSKHGSTRFQHHYVPAWLGLQQQLQHDAATTSSSASSSSSSPSSTSSSSCTSYIITTLASFCSKIITWFQYNEMTRHKLFLMELSLWAFSFIGLGIWAIYL